LGTISRSTPGPRLLQFRDDTRHLIWEAHASTNIDPTTLRQIENVVSDPRNSEYQSFGKHLKKLSRLLHSPELEPATARLIKDIDLEGWLKAGEDTQGGMIGSAKLEWPSEHEKELGTVVVLIDHFADNPDEALNFIGRLTRSRVCALKRGNVEVPSDFGAVVYTEFDENGGWKTSLGKELEAAGFQIDWNVAMRA
jgi:hypothetical protein